MCIFETWSFQDTPYNSEETLCKGLVENSGDTRVAFRVFRDQERRSILDPRESELNRRDPRKRSWDILLRHCKVPGADRAVV